jgi:dTDP-glucose pyrophosphorylase
MAGSGSRFRNAGYMVPKYMIEAKGKTLFELSMLSLSGYEPQRCKLIFIACREDHADSFISSYCAKNGMTDYYIIELEKQTDGQATTAMMAQKYWGETEPLLIYNIDTFVEPGEMNSTQLKGDGFIPCFVGTGDHWSFVKLGEKEQAIEIREKKRISDFCTLGAYYFKSCSLYKKLYEEYYKDDSHNEKGEKYIAPLYSYLIELGGLIYISVVPKEKVHVLGTPEELNAYIKKN